MRIKDIIESFDSDVKGNILPATNSRFSTSARIGNREIVFSADRWPAGMGIIPEYIWEIDFVEYSKLGATFGKSGNGNELQVLTFVIESLKDLVSRYSPETIRFESQKSEGNRTSLYKRLARRIKLPGYQLSDIESGNNTDTFTTVRDK